MTESGVLISISGNWAAIEESALAVIPMQAGIVFGYIGQVEYIVKKIKEEYGENLKVISTGGLGKILYHQTACIDVYDRELTFKGLKIIYDKNKKKIKNPA